MKLLVIGHSLVIDSNRSFWNVFAQKNKAIVDAIVPLFWSSNLKKDIPYSYNSQTDESLRKTYPLKTYFKGNGSLYFHSPSSLFEVFQQNRYDVIFVNQETWALSTLLIIFIKFFSINREAKLFLCVAQNIKKTRLGFLHPYERFISKFVYRFLFCSQEVEEVLRWKRITTPCVYFPLPYDDLTYQSLKVNNDNDTFVLGYLGRLAEEKGLSILLKACDELKRAQIPFKLLIGGNGPMINEIKTRDYVSFLGVIPHNQAHKFYEQIHCFVLPSQTRKNWKEQFGRVIVESFGAGKPVIGSSSGSIPEVLNRLDWPWIFKEDSSTELYDLIRKIIVESKSNLFLEQLEHSKKINYKLFSQSEVAMTLYSNFLK